jgi:3'(2'), 5'-bisphosphate nucleotidase
VKKINPAKLIKQLIPTFYKAGSKSIALSKKLKIIQKDDGTPVSNGDLAVDDIIQKKLRQISPDIEIVSEETIKKNKLKKRQTFWLVDPIDGTGSYIKGGSEYTLNVGLIVNRKPVAGIIYAPKKKRLFYSLGKNQSYEIFNKKKNIKLNCKQNLKREKIALTNSPHPSNTILKIMKKHKINNFVNMRSSLKFCMIAASEFDLYAARARAREWDIAAGHAIVENAGASVRTHSNKKIFYGKKGFKNPSILVLRKPKMR